MYNKNLWKTKEIISTDKLNNIEQGIYNSSIGGNSIPVVTLTGDASQMTGHVASNLQFDFNDGEQDVTGYVKTKWQGDSSQNYPKKNLSFKFYTDSTMSKKMKWKPKSDWAYDNEYNLKANYIDRTHARNLVNAKIVAEVYAAQPIYYGNENMMPAYLAKFEIKDAIKNARLDGVIGKQELSNPLVCSLDVTLNTDKGKDSSGKSQNFATVWFNDETGAQVGYTQLDLTDTAVGTSKHFSINIVPSSGHFIRSAVFNTGVNSKPGDGDVTFSNIALYKGTGEPSGYSYVPSLYDSHQKLQASPLFGQVQGFPVEMYLNGKDMGLYTFNTRKNATLVNLDSSDNSNIMIETGNDNPFWPGHVLKFDGLDADAEVAKDKAIAKKLFQRLITFEQSATNEDFKNNIAKYVDVYSIIDSYILTFVMNNIDGLDKSVLPTTWDGQHWFLIPYDLDSTWGSQWDGTRLPYVWDTCRAMNYLSYRVITLFNDLVLERYSYLRNGVLSAHNIINEFQNFIDNIPIGLYNNNEKIWPGIPDINYSDFAQIKQAVSTQLAITDNAIENNLSDTSSVDTSATGKGTTINK